MRLLECNNAGEFSLTEDIIDDDKTPPYAILSHTWKEGEEVAFQELIDGTGKAKPGYEKIRFCGAQAKRDGLQYFWVDTCCINRSNNAELSEAINSMFRWYRSATRCYVYLSDVSSPAFDTNDKLSELPFELAFRRSRWFTRGWTLQELLAPSSVEFFSREGNRFGDKRSLQQKIHEITGITVQALHEVFLSRFGVDERLSWAQNRQTTRKEDQAYALLGIFGVYMPLIYGEGRDNALNRLLREIHNKPLQGSDRLPCALEAPFNSTVAQHMSTCLPDTRVELLREIYGWADGKDERCIFWLNGLAGTGKSTISRTVARKWYERGRLGASFFFSQGGGDVGHAGKFVTSIAVQLASSVPTIYQFICDAITQHSDIASRSLHDQWQLLVLDPLSKLDGNGCRASYVLVVDALDECDDDSNIRIILQLLAEARSLETVRLLVFLTSRPEIPIRYGICRIPDTEHKDFILHDISPAIVDHDITLFLEYNLRLIQQECVLDAGWPGEEVIDHLVRKASGLFIWAATACRFIRGGREFASERLSFVLNGNPSIIDYSSADDSSIEDHPIGDSMISPEVQLNKIYIAVLQNSIRNHTKQERKKKYKQVREVAGTIALLISPLSTFSLAGLLHVPREEIIRTLNDLYSILDIPEGRARLIRLHHPSFRDFLLSKERCGDSKWWVDEKQAHGTLATNCIQLMSASLKQDICGQDAPGVLVADIESSLVEKYLPPEVQYACLYWIQHLQKSGIQLSDNDYVHQFLKEHFLHWLEALSWMQKVSVGIYAITSLESITLTSDCPYLYAFIHDMKRFALCNRQVIEQAPLQVYCSALVFAPEMSIVRKQFKDRVPQWMKRLPEVEKGWSALIQTLDGHSGSVYAVAFSPDGRQLASASYDETVRLWDAATGAALQTLKGHSNSVRSVSFALDGRQLASASVDKTVRLWDAGTGAALKILKGHSDWVYAVAFSPDGRQLASASADETIRFWDARTGASLQTLKGHGGVTHAVAFSPDGRQLASASDDETIRFWDAETGATLQTLKGHSDWVGSVAFSPDGQQLVSASGDKTVRLWDVGTGAILQTLKGHTGWIRSVAFSPNGRQLATASDDNTIRLWDVVTGAMLQTLEGHSDWVISVTFSPNGRQLASASNDNTIRLWDTGTSATLQTLEGHSKSVYAVAFSPNGRQLALALDDKTIQLWDERTSATLQTLKGHSSWVYAVAFSPDGQQLASASDDETIRLWNTGTVAALQTLEGHIDSVNGVAFSPDGRQLASASDDETIRLWDVETGATLQTLKGHSTWVGSVAFSPNGQQLASASGDKTVRLWDVGTGAILQTLKGHSDWVGSVAFSPNGQQLASASGDKTVFLWNARTGAALQMLEGHSGWVYAVAFSPDGWQLASASNDGTIRLWDVATGATLQTLESLRDIRTLTFSIDGSYLQTDRGSIRLRYPTGNILPQSANLSNLLIGGEWITRDEVKLFWLPHGYRPAAIAVGKDIIAIKHKSGPVSILELSF